MERNILQYRFSIIKILLNCRSSIKLTSENSFKIAVSSNWGGVEVSEMKFSKRNVKICVCKLKSMCCGAFLICILREGNKNVLFSQVQIASRFKLLKPFFKSNERQLRSWHNFWLIHLLLHFPHPFPNRTWPNRNLFSFSKSSTFRLDGISVFLFFCRMNFNILRRQRW